MPTQRALPKNGRYSTEKTIQVFPRRLQNHFHDYSQLFDEADEIDFNVMITSASEQLSQARAAVHLYDIIARDGSQQEK
jgi:hypothetical protein